MEHGIRMSKRRLKVAMVAYANYFTDARIKNYVDALLDAGAQVDVFALGTPIGATQEGNLSINNLASKYTGHSKLRSIMGTAGFMVRAMARLFYRSFRGRYDVIHAHNMPDILALVGLPFRPFGTKVILDVHDTMPEAYATKFGYELDQFPVKLFVQEELLSAACSNKVITTNVMHKEVLVEHGIPEDNIELIYNVGNTKYFKPLARGTNGQELWLGYHGTVTKRLGVFLIVDALNLLKKDCPGLRFLCVGEGDDLDAMKHRAEEKGVSDMIDFRPFTEVEKLPEALRKVHVGIIGNQRDTERKRNYMLPVKMLEYAAMEIPTIAPRLQILERYFDESSAFFYESDDADSLADMISSIYHDRALLSTRAEGLRKFNAQYNWNIMAKRYLTLINDLTLRQ